MNMRFGKREKSWTRASNLALAIQGVALLSHWHTFYWSLSFFTFPLTRVSVPWRHLHVDAELGDFS